MIVKEYVIYKITNKINNKIYIGMTCNVNTRWSGNGTQYRPKGENKNIPFWNAIIKYGWSNFKKEILEYNLTYEEAIDREIYYIAFFNSTNRDIGYNLSPGGNGGKVYAVHPKGMKGKHHTEENKTRQSKFMKENNPMNTIRWGKTHEHPRGMKGKKQTDRQKAIAKQNRYSCKTVIAITPDGETKTFTSLNDCCKYFDLRPTSSTVRNLLKSGKPYKFSKQIKTNVEKFKALEGLTLNYA